MDVLRQLPNFPFGPNNTVPMVTDGTVGVPGVPGALAQDPGYLSLMNQFQAPQMNTTPFDPRGALMGGALMDLSEIILGKNPTNNPMKAYQMGRQMYMQDRSLENQQKQQAFQNQMAVGTLVAQLQKAGLPSSTAGKLARDMFGKNLNELSTEEMTQLGAIAKQFSASTNIAVDASTKGNTQTFVKLAENAAKRMGEMDEIIAGAPGTLDVIDTLSLLNRQISTAGVIGNLSDSVNRVLLSLGSDFRVTADTPFREAYDGLSKKLALSELAFFKGPTTDFEFGVAAAINGNLDQTAEGRQILLDLAKGRNLMNREAAQAYNDYAYRVLQDPNQKVPPNRAQFTNSEEYKQLQLKTQYTLNPGSLGKVIKNYTPEDRVDFIAERKDDLRPRYEKAYSDATEQKIEELLSDHIRLEIGTR